MPRQPPAHVILDLPGAAEQHQLNSPLCDHACAQKEQSGWRIQLDASAVTHRHSMGRPGACGLAMPGIEKRTGEGPSRPRHRRNGVQWHPALLADRVADPRPAAGSSRSTRVSSSPAVVASSVVS
jgi:hypothetical protein